MLSRTQTSSIRHAIAIQLGVLFASASVAAQSVTNDVPTVPARAVGASASSSAPRDARSHVPFTLQPEPGRVPLMIRSLRRGQEVLLPHDSDAPFPDPIREARLFSPACATPCTIYVRPGIVTFRTGGLDVTSGGHRIIVGTGPVGVSVSDHSHAQRVGGAFLAACSGGVVLVSGTLWMLGRAGARSASYEGSPLDVTSAAVALLSLPAIVVGLVMLATNGPPSIERSEGDVHVLHATRGFFDPD